MKKILTRITIFLFLTIVMLYALTPLFCPNESSNYRTNRIKAFHKLPANSIDIIAFGSSHTYRSINANLLNDNYNLNTYVYANSWQRINTTAAFLSDSLLTQKPKIAVFEIANVGNGILEQTGLQGESYYTRELKITKSKIKMLYQYFNFSVESHIDYLFPVLCQHSNLSGIKNNITNIINRNDDIKEIQENRGSYNTDEVTKIVIGKNSTEQLPLDLNVLDSLIDIVEMCKKNDIEIIFYTQPCEKDFKYHDAIDAFAKGNDIRFIDLYDMVDEVGLNGKTDYADTGHVNNSGAKKITNYLGQYILDNYSFEKEDWK